MEDQINRLRAMEASSGSASTLSPNSAFSTGGVNSLDASGVSANQQLPVAVAGGANAQSESSPGAAATGTAISRPTTTVTDVRRETSSGDVTRMEVAAEVRSWKISALIGYWDWNLLCFCVCTLVRFPRWSFHNLPLIGIDRIPSLLPLDGTVGINLFAEFEVPIPFQLKLDYRVTRLVVPYVLLTSKQKLRFV